MIRVKTIATAVVAITFNLCSLAWAQSTLVLDRSRLPPMDAGGAAGYERFINGDLPRAWAISPNGKYGGSWGGSRNADAVAAAALNSCADKGGIGCEIYAADLDVVWHGAQPLPHSVPPPSIFGEGYSFVPDARFFWRGPRAAAGVVVWGHGYGGPGEDHRGRQPPSFLRPLNNAGYDIIRFDRHPAWDGDADKAAGWLRDGLAALRAQGWRKIVAGGQSRGGWNSLQMLLSPGSVDAVIAASAARSGTNAGNVAMSGETKLWSLTHDVPRQATRLVYIQFSGDPYAGDEDKRAALVRDAAGPKLGALLLIDRPDGLSGHGAAANFAFGDRFGPCIAHFIMDDAPKPAC